MNLTNRGVYKRDVKCLGKATRSTLSHMYTFSQRFGHRPTANKVDRREKLSAEFTRRFGSAPMGDNRSPVTLKMIYFTGYDMVVSPSNATLSNLRNWVPNALRVKLPDALYPCKPALAISYNIPGSSWSNLRTQVLNWCESVPNFLSYG